MTIPSPSDTASVWSTVSDEILAGFSHALNNRLAAVGSIARVLEYGDAGDLYASLINEIDQLEETVGLLRLIPRTDEDRVEPIRLEDFVPPVTRLHALRRDARDMEFVLASEGSVLPGFAEPVLLTRAMLIALEIVARVVREGGGTRVDLRFPGQDSASLLIEGRLAVELEIGDGGVELSAAGALARSAGARLDQEGSRSGSTYTLRFTLPLEPADVVTCEDAG